MNSSIEDKTPLTCCLPEATNLSRKDRRKLIKKLHRKQLRRQAAEEEKLEEIARLDDPAEQLRIQLEEQTEAELLLKEKAEHDEQEKIWIEREQKAMEDFHRQQEEHRKMEEDRKLQYGEEDWRYVEGDGPPEVIFVGNEIIVRKRRVKQLADPPTSRVRKDADQPTSNPLPPQSAAFAAHKLPQTPVVTEQDRMFGTEQDKTHCPFHIKTGVCRFGVRCSRVHVYPDQSFTLLMRNMYTGPGLTWENDEGLEPFLFDKRSLRIQSSKLIKEGGKRSWWLDERKQASTVHSDEEVAQHYEEFYEDVHSEFLQFGEIVNFKVCQNASSHLRGNVYVHFKTEAGAQAAYSAMNGRFYAGKQITCEFVGVTRWRAALCGEFMKGHHRSCSHGTACNFLHCFRNPRKEYDWADWDAVPPRYWSTKMGKLFGYSKDLKADEDGYNRDARRRRGSDDSSSGGESRSRKRNHRSRRAPSYASMEDFERTTRHRERQWHVSRDHHRHLISDDMDRSSRQRWRGRHGSRSDHHSSDSDDLDEFSRRRTYHNQDRDHQSPLEEVEERGRWNDRDAACSFHSSDEEGVGKDYHVVKDDREKQYLDRKHKRKQQRHTHKNDRVHADVDIDRSRGSKTQARSSRSRTHRHDMMHADEDTDRTRESKTQDRISRSHTHRHDRVHADEDIDRSRECNTQDRISRSHTHRHDKVHADEDIDRSRECNTQDKSS